MSEELAFPTAVVLGLWLNAAQSKSVSPTDAANALETITSQYDIPANSIESGSERLSWLDLVQRVISLRTPVAVGLPTDGDPAGVPVNVLTKVDRSCGVVAINQDLLLVQLMKSEWAQVTMKNTVVHHNLAESWRILADQMAASTMQLAASDLVGDETEIMNSLDAFRSLHLPPHLSKRSTDALESAAKILLVCRGAISKSVALHSPSTDRLRVQLLEDLIAKSRTVLQSVVTN
jgi:hypothetical protein